MCSVTSILCHTGCQVRLAKIVASYKIQDELTSGTTNSSAKCILQPNLIWRRLLRLTTNLYLYKTVNSCQIHLRRLSRL